MLSNINENNFGVGCSFSFNKLNPFGKQWLIIDSSNDIVFFVIGGKYEIIFGSNSFLYFVFNSSISDWYSQLWVRISGDIPITKK